MRPRDAEGFWRQLPLLAGVLVCGGAALSALAASVEEPLYEFLLYAGLGAGLLISAVGLRRRKVIAWPGALVMVLAFSLFGLAYARFPLAYLLYPPEIQAHEDMVLAAMVGWFLVAFSCWQSSRTNLIFLIVAGLAIFGLTGTVNLNVEMRFAFAAFVLGAVFCWSYEQFLDADDRLVKNGQPRLPHWGEMVRGHLSVAVLVGLLTFSAGSLIGTGAYRVSPNVYAKMARRIYGWDARVTRLVFNTFQTEFQVGTGPVRLLPIPVLKIKASHAALWRGMAYNVYTGRGWKQESIGESAQLRDLGSRYEVPRDRVEFARAGRWNDQEVTVLGYPGILFASAQPARVLPHLPEGARRPPVAPRIDIFGCLSWMESDTARRYRVVSWEPTEEPRALRSATAEYHPWYEEHYLSVPAVTRLALEPTVEEITAGLTNPYDRVAALQKYLEDHCLYSLGAPATPRSEDAAAYFVLHSKRGACDSFATALAVMARLAGVPARVATGYQTGEWDDEEQALIVKGDDAHAWAEIYFPGYGWVPFEPQAQEQYEHQSVAELLTSEHWRWAVRDVSRKVGWVLGVALVAFLALAALVDPWRVVRRAFAPRPRTPLQRLSSDYRAFYGTLLKRAGARPDPALTPQEAVAQGLVALPPRYRQALQDLNERFYHLRFAPRPRREAIEAMRRELRQLRKQLRRR